MSRFICPSAEIDLKDLLSRGNRGLLIGFLLAASLHFSLTTVGRYGAAEHAVKPLTTRFVKREPRLVKPLELRKRPLPKKRPMRRKVIPIRTRAIVKESTASFQTTKILDSLVKPKSGITREVSFAASELEPQFGLPPVTSAVNPEDRIDVSLEMLDIEALDTGRYQALVIQDPRDKKKIKGFFHLNVCYSETMRMVDFHGADARVRYALIRIIRAINKYTGIKANMGERFTFASEKMFTTPWILAAPVASFNPTDSEIANLGRYLTSGGFFFADSWGNLDMPESVGALESLKDMIINALGSQGLEFGKDWDFERLPKSHPVYHCFFDFDGPPTGADRPARFSGSPVSRSADPFLRGVIVDGRLVTIYSNKGYPVPWGDWGPGGAGSRMGHSYAQFDPTRPLQFAVNLIIFALTQEGSITHQVMNYLE